MTSRRLLACLAVLLLAGTVWLVRASGLNHDVAWFLEIARQLREGATLDGSGPRDPKELNPPLGIWLFVPALWLASALGLPATAAPVLLVALEAAAAVGVTWRMLRVLPPGARDGCVLAAALATVSLAGYDFAEREHQLVLLLTPALWSLALCAADRPASRTVRVLAGALAGVGVAFKPHFVVAWGAVEIATAITARRPRLLWRAETLTAAIVLLSYAASVLVWTPGYLPLVLGAAPGYLAQAEPWLALAGEPEALLALAVLIAVTLWRGPSLVGRASLTYALAAAAFALVGIVQRKGFSYHWYPGFAWSVLAALLGAASVAAEGRRRLVPYGAVLALLGTVAWSRLHVGILRTALHRETARQFAVAVGGPARTSHDLFILGLPVEGAFPAVTYLGLRWPAGMSPGLMHIAMPRVVVSGDAAPTEPAFGDADQPLRDAVWEEVSASIPRVIAVSPMYSRGVRPQPSATRTVADFFTVDPRFAEFFSHYEPAGRVDRLGQPYYVVLRRTTITVAPLDTTARAPR